LLRLLAPAGATQFFANVKEIKSENSIAPIGAQAIERRGIQGLAPLATSCRP
jgi:hypothetical protein